MPVVPPQIWKLAQGIKTVTQMRTIPEFKKLPPTYPSGYNTSTATELARWTTPDKSRSALWRAETRAKTLSGRMFLRGYARARWFVPAMTYAKMLYIKNNFFTTNADYAIITLQMPTDFGFEGGMVTMNGILYWPWPDETMQRPESTQQDFGWRDVEFNFERLSDANP